MPRDRRRLVFESLRVAVMELVEGIPTATGLLVVVGFSQGVVKLLMKVKTRIENWIRDGKTIIVEREKAVAGGSGADADAAADGALLEGEAIRRAKGPAVFVQLEVILSAHG